MSEPEKFCEQAPPIYESFLKVIFDHAVGDQILGPTKNPCPTFFNRRATGDVWDKQTWGNYPQGNDVVKLPLKPVQRLVAIGDFHGDLRKAREALEIAQVLGPNDTWSGGKSVLVQVGDVFDRGMHEIKICYLLEKLRRSAYRRGGAVHVLHGNHETENVLGKYRYVLKDGFKEFHHWKSWYDIHNSMKGMVQGCSPTINYEQGLPTLQKVPELDGVDFDSEVGNGILGRLVALRPGGPMATQFLAQSPAVLVIGKSMFVHGGIKFNQVIGGYKTLNRYNSKVNEWLKGDSVVKPPAIIASTGDGVAITWNRDLGSEDKQSVQCTDLFTTLYTMNLERLVIGHTIQLKRLINSACNQKVIRIDVGMSRGCVNNPPQALEILDDERCNVLSAKGSMPLSEADELPPRKRDAPEDGGKTTRNEERQKKPKKLRKKKKQKTTDGEELKKRNEEHKKEEKQKTTDPQGLNKRHKEHKKEGLNKRPKEHKKEEKQKTTDAEGLNKHKHKSGNTESTIKGDSGDIGDKA